MAEIEADDELYDYRPAESTVCAICTDDRDVLGGIWIDRNKFMKNVIYRYNILRKLAVKGYEILLSPVYSREYYLVDNIVKLLNLTLNFLLVLSQNFSL